jgi:hypothetical protein
MIVQLRVHKDQGPTLRRFAKAHADVGPTSFKARRKLHLFGQCRTAHA